MHDQERRSSNATDREMAELASLVAAAVAAIGRRQHYAALDDLEVAVALAARLQNGEQLGAIAVLAERVSVDAADGEHRARRVLRLTAEIESAT